MKSTGITAHMIVKNEDQWVWYAINSVLPYVDTFLITDTGSTDHTLDLIRRVRSPKIKLTQTQIQVPADMTRARNDQIVATSTEWIWLVDGDEIYSHSAASEIVTAVQADQYKCIAVRRNDLLGDVYHRQMESVGSYALFGERGHLVTRLFNLKSFRNLKVMSDYPNEEYVYAGSRSTSHLPLTDVYITQSYLYHAMYLQRSSLGSNLTNMFNRSKYKIELGIAPVGTTPEVFTNPHPNQLMRPLAKRGLVYELLANVITPIKALKRLLLPSV